MARFFVPSLCGLAATPNRMTYFEDIVRPPLSPWYGQEMLVETGSARMRRCPAEGILKSKHDKNCFILFHAKNSTGEAWRVGET